MPIKVFSSVFKIFIVSLLNKPRLPAKNHDRHFSTKIFEHLAYPGQPTFCFIQTQVNQSNTADNDFKISKTTYTFSNCNVLETQKIQLKPTFIFSNPSNPGKPSL